MIDTIRNNINIFQSIVNCCEENKASVEFSGECLCDDGDINDNLVVIVKIDNYYNTKDFPKPPKSIDCLIVINNKTNFELYLVELKDVSSPKHIHRKAIIDKFDTAFNRFMSADFSSIFLDEKYIINHVRAWLICTLYPKFHLSDDQYRKKIKGTVLDLIQSVKPYRFRGKLVPIEVKYPIPQIVI